MMNNFDRNPQHIFGEALALADPAQRAAYLDEACAGNQEMRAEIESLLQAHEQAANFLCPMDAPESAQERPSDRVGRYKLLEQIGAGGFGEVWMAEQEEPVRRRVALKIIKLGMDTKEVVARFEAERQALAMMNHPSIATVFDGGATAAGRPYFVMELVKGVPITDYCDASKLPTRDRLELFIQVCHAVQHAHQKGIIHRDLKPSNILVTVQDDRPVPKVIDFGVAKATQTRLTDKTLFTHFHQWIGTPAYMSPEQAGLANHDVDTRSDVYSLGVLLYELLTGQTPFDTKKLLSAGYDSMMRTIRENDPPKPSTRISTLAATELTAVAARRGTEPAKLNHLVRGDLDWVVMKALEKDRARRYATANALARDLEQHLCDKPVSAMAPGTLYMFQKFLRRHWAGLATAAALVVILALGAGISAWQALRAGRQARVAESRRLEAEASRQKASRLLTRNYEREGTRLLNERDLTGALVYFTEALQRDEENPGHARLHRLRIAMVLAQCPELKGLLMHAGSITTAQFTPDGSEIVSAANIKNNVTQIRVWETAGLRPVSDCLVKTDCERVILSPGGSWIATYDQVGLLRAHTISLWNARQTGPGLILFTNSSSLGVTAVPGYRWDDPRMIYGVPSLRNPRNAVLGFSQDDRRAVLAHANQVRVWDMARGCPVGESVRLSNEVIYAALSSDGSKLALCVERSKTNTAAKGEVLLLDATTLESIAPPLLHHGLPIFADFDVTGRRVVTASVCSERPLLNIRTNWDFTTGEAQVWDASSGRPLTPPLRHDQPAYQAELSPDGRTLASVTGNPKRLLDEEIGDGQMHFWNLSAKVEPERFYTIPLAGLITAAFAPDGRRVLAGRHYEVMEPWWNLKGKHPPDAEGFSLALEGSVPDIIRLKFAHSDFFVSYSPDGRRCLVSNKGKALQVWQWRASVPWMQTPQAELAGKASPAGLLIIPDSMRPGANEGGMDVLWRFSRDGRRIGMCLARNSQAPASEASNTVQNWNVQAAIWQSQGGAPIVAREACQELLAKPFDAAFDDAGRFLIALPSRKGVRVLDGTTGKEHGSLLLIEDINEAVETAAFSPDCSRLIACIARLQPPAGEQNYGSAPPWRLRNVERLLRVWELGSGIGTDTPLPKLAGEAGETARSASGREGSGLAAFSPDARRAVVKASRNRFRIWDLASQSPLTPHIPLVGSLISAEFSRDGALLLTFSQSEKNKVLQIWHAGNGDPLSPPLPVYSMESCSFAGTDAVGAVGCESQDYRCMSLALASDLRSADSLVRLAQWLSGRILDTSGALTELDAEAWQALNPLNR